MLSLWRYRKWSSCSCWCIVHDANEELLETVVVYTLLWLFNRLVIGNTRLIQSKILLIFIFGLIVIFAILCFHIFSPSWGFVHNFI